MKDFDKSELIAFLYSDEGKEILKNTFHDYASQLKEVYDVGHISDLFFRLTARRDESRTIVVGYSAMKEILMVLGEMHYHDALSFIKHIRLGNNKEVVLSGFNVSYEPTIKVIHEINTKHLDKMLSFQSVIHIFRTILNPYFEKFLNDGIKDEELYDKFEKSFTDLHREVDESKLLKWDKDVYKKYIDEWIKAIRLFHVHDNNRIDTENEYYMRKAYEYYDKVKEALNIDEYSSE